MRGGQRAEVTNAGGPRYVITLSLRLSRGFTAEGAFSAVVTNGRLSADSRPAQAAAGDIRSRQSPQRPTAPIIARQPASLAAAPRGDHCLRAMSRPSGVSPRPPAPGGGGGGPAQCGPGGGGRAKGLKDIRIDEEVKIAVNIALERFRYGDQRGEVPVRDPAACPTSPNLDLPV